MKEYVIPASEIVSGYKRNTRTRYRTVSETGTVTTSWENDYSHHEDSSSNRIKYDLSSSSTLVENNANYKRYRDTQKLDYYRIDMTFDLSDVPVNRIQSVAFRARLMGKDDNTPRGYYISSVGAEGGVFTNSNPHFQNRDLLGNCSLGTPESMPYTHDTTLSGLSNTGWYTIWNDFNTDYAYNELLAFSMYNFYLVITTDETVVATYTITYDKGTYGTGTNQTDTKTDGAAIALKSAIFTRQDYTQTGWSVNANGSTKDYSLGANYTADADITLYPYWTIGHVAVGNVLFIMTESGLQPIL